MLVARRRARRRAARREHAAVAQRRRGRPGRHGRRRRRRSCPAPRAQACVACHAALAELRRAHVRLVDQPGRLRGERRPQVGDVRTGIVCRSMRSCTWPSTASGPRRVGAEACSCVDVASRRPCSTDSAALRHADAHRRTPVGGVRSPAPARGRRRTRSRSAAAMLPQVRRGRCPAGPACARSAAARRSRRRDHHRDQPVAARTPAMSFSAMTVSVWAGMLDGLLVEVHHHADVLAGHRERRRCPGSSPGGSCWWVMMPSISTRGTAPNVAIMITRLDGLQQRRSSSG